MNKKELRYAFNQVLQAAESKMCEEMHHKPSQYHKAGEMCPVEYALQRQCHIVREYMKEQGI